MAAGFAILPSDIRPIDALARVEANALSLFQTISEYHSRIGGGQLATDTSIAARAPENRRHLEGGAIVIHPPSFCSLLDGNGGLISTTDAMIVQTPSKRGNQMIRCRLKRVANGSGRAVHFDAQNNPLMTGQPCFVLGQPTLRWHETVSASGNAVLVCHLP